MKQLALLSMIFVGSTAMTFADQCNDSGTQASAAELKKKEDAKGNAKDQYSPSEEHVDTEAKLRSGE